MYPNEYPYRKFRKLFQMKNIGGQRRIRTFEGVSHQISRNPIVSYKRGLYHYPDLPARIINLCAQILGIPVSSLYGAPDHCKGGVPTVLASLGRGSFHRYPGMFTLEFPLKAAF